MAKRYWFNPSMSTGASAASAASAAQMRAVRVCLADAAALAVSFLFLHGLWVRIILPLLAKT